MLKINHKSSIASVIHLITDYRLLITMSALLLTSCMGVYEGGFECPPGEGVGCKSISEVNQMVDQGLGTRSQESGSKLSQEPKAGVCDRPDSCPLSPDFPEIWYSPSFKVDPQEKGKTKVLDDPISI